MRIGLVAVALAALFAAPAAWATETLGHATSGAFPAGGSASAGFGGPGAGGPGGFGGDSAPARAAIAVVAKVCRAVRVPTSSVTMYDCRGRAAGIAAAAQ